MDGNDHVQGGGVGSECLLFVQATKKERAVIRAMLSRLAESAPTAAGVGRASAWAWAGLRLAAFVLLAAGVGIGLGDGDEFDDVGCSVAQQPGGTSQGAHTAKTRERAGDKLAGSEGGAAGAGGGAGPFGGKAEEGLWDDRPSGVPDRTSNIQHPTSNVEGGGGRSTEVGGKGEEGLRTTGKGEALSPPLAGKAGPFRYSLRHEGWGWVFECSKGRVCFKPEIGLSYVGWLLAAPDEAVPCAKLFSRFSGGQRKDLPIAELPDPETGASQEVTDAVGMAQWLPDKDEAEARNRYYAQLMEYKETIGNSAVPESERAEAQRLYDDLVTFLKKHYQRAPDPGRAMTKLVHRSIRRLCDHLREPMPGERASNPVAAALGEYITKHILVPSRRYTRAKPGANVRVARGELAGRLIFECPPDDRWCVQL
jgi:hypothetical protein